MSFFYVKLQGPPRGYAMLCYATLYYTTLYDTTCAYGARAPPLGAKGKKKATGSPPSGGERRPVGIV